MAYTFQELAKMKNDLVSRFGISTTDAARVVGYCSQNNIDFNPAALGPVFSELGISPGEPVPGDLIPAKISTQRKKSTQERPTKEKKKDTSPADVPQCIQDINAPHNETIIDTLPQALPDTDIITDTCDYSDLLPPGLYDDICDIITNFCKKNNIPDRMKIHPLQWRAACYDVGYMIKKRGLLNDVDKLRKYGGRYYNPQKVLALLRLYEYICSTYKQTAFAHNFSRFAGVSDEYINDYAKRGLSSAQVGLAQKTQEIQRASIVGAISGGGNATVGNIFLGKALAGLQETSTVVHVSASPSVNLAELPKLDQLPG